MIKLISTKQKYIIIACIPTIIIKTFLPFFFTTYKNERKDHKFWQQKNQKQWLLQKKKKIFNIDDLDVNKILVSKIETYGKYNLFKYFIGYNDNDVIRPLYLELSQMTGYINEFDENKLRMSFIIKDKQLLKNYKKNMDKNWKINEYRFWQQNYLWWWW